MKKSILALGLVGTLLIVTTGCGGGDDDDKTKSFEDIELEFKTNATYDLSQYIIPAQNQTNSYIEKTYIDEEGKKKYSETPDEEIDTAKTFEVNSTTIKEYDGSELDTTLHILSDKIQNIDENLSIVRFANKGDYIIKNSGSQVIKDLSYDTTQLCKLDDHYNSKKVRNKTYFNVIEITCTSTKIYEGMLGDKVSSFDNASTRKIYFSKGKGEGMISSVEENCKTTKLGDIISKECEKKTVEITTIL